MDKLKEQCQQILEETNKSVFYSICFTNYFDATKFNSAWHINKIDDKYYYFNDHNSLSTPYYINAYHKEFLKVLAFIDNNKVLALLNIRTYKWAIVDMIIQEILKGNEVYLEKV
jgi:hypothetical protein